MKQYFGIDIGGTAVKLGIVDETGRVLLKGEESVSFDGYQTPVLTTVRRAAKEFLTTNAIPVESLAGIGVSATGQIDSRKGIVAGTCGNFPNYIGSPIKSALEEDFGLPVTVANDANCMTLGEVWVGAAQGYTDVIGVTLGTGVGGGILTGGHLLEGARGLGGELGHYRTHALDGVDCTCGAKAAGNATLPPPRWCAPHRKRTPIGRTAAPSLPQPKQATRQFLPCWTTGRTRSHRALQAWCTSSTRSSF